MKMKQLTVAMITLLLTASCSEKQQDYPFRNPDLPLEERIDDLLSRLTPEEKIGQMMNVTPAIERLGIPTYDWWNEALHGVPDVRPYSRKRSPWRLPSMITPFTRPSRWSAMRPVPNTINTKRTRSTTVTKVLLSGPRISISFVTLAGDGVWKLMERTLT